MKNVTTIYYGEEYMLQLSSIKYWYIGTRWEMGSIGIIYRKVSRPAQICFCSLQITFDYPLSMIPEFLMYEI